MKVSLDDGITYNFDHVVPARLVYRNTSKVGTLPIPASHLIVDGEDGAGGLAVIGEGILRRDVHSELGLGAAD